MKKLILLLTACGLIGAQTTLARDVFVVVGQPRPPAGGGGLSITKLTDGQDTASNPATTASVSPAASSMVYLCIGYAVAGGGTATGSDTATVSGLGLTWTLVENGTDGTGRRGTLLYRGTGTASSGTISITLSTGSGTWTETFWSVLQVTGHNSGDPDDAPVSAANWSGGVTSGATGDVGTIDAGDAVIAFFIHETSEAVDITGFTELTDIFGGTDVRSLTAAYSTSDDTPAATWSTSSGWEGMGWVVNKAP